MRRCPHGDPDAAKNQRTASAPCASISPIGSMTLPRCLDIFRPCSSVTSPRHTTFSYDDRPNTSVLTDISEENQPGVWLIASEMNCAGYADSNDSRFRSGAPHCANGIDPESNQTSITSVDRD